MIGMPKGAENRLWFVPNDQQPYFMREVDVPDPAGLGPVRMDIELHRGIWITGKVTDGATGAPVPTVRMLYLPFLTNEYAQRTPEFHPNGFVDGNARQTRFQSKADGTYRIVGLPGPAIVGAESILKSYRHGVGYADISGPKHQEGTGRLVRHVSSAHEARSQVAQHDEGDQSSRRHGAGNARLRIGSGAVRADPCPGS